MLREATAKTWKNPLWIRSGLNKPRLIWGRSVFLSQASNVSERLERAIVGYGLYLTSFSETRVGNLLRGYEFKILTDGLPILSEHFCRKLFMLESPVADRSSLLCVKYRQGARLDRHKLKLLGSGKINFLLCASLEFHKLVYLKRILTRNN